jgi:acetyltransferase-like isoleucine patch superfamily enzyme
MKILKQIISYLNWIYLFLLNRKVPTKGNKFYLTKFSIAEGNSIIIENSNFKMTRINIQGVGNTVKANKSLFENCLINIKGQNNKLILGEGVKLRGAVVHIRGDNCSIMIGKNTSTGGVRIVNVGKNNDIIIGENCLFSDFIEIWASDTHSILNEKGEKINKERPIKLGNNVWVGSHVTILKGVTIEDWAIIGMGAMVVNDIPKNSISVGFPNKIVKENVTWKLDY